MSPYLNLLSKPWVVGLLAAGIWGADRLIGHPVFLGIVAILVIGVSVAGVVHWRKNGDTHDEQE